MMKPVDDVTVRIADWARDRDALREIRKRVFIEEQQVPVELEWDEYDSVAVHFIAETGGLAVGCGRLKPDGQIGRMAVLGDYRGSGIGSTLLRAILAHCQQAGLDEPYLHAQVQVTGFYEKAGFVAEGELFEDAGISHRAMRMKCAT